MITNASTRGDLHTRHLYCQDLFHAAPPITGQGYKATHDYYLVGETAPVHLVQVKVLSDSTGTEGELAIVCKDTSDVSATTTVASFKPSTSTITCSSINLEGAVAASGAVSASSGISLGNPSGVTTGSTSLLNYYEQGFSFSANLSADGDGTSSATVQFRGIRIGNVVGLTMAAIGDSLTKSTAYTVSTSSLFAGRSAWAPKETVYAVSKVISGGATGSGAALGIAELTTDGVVTIYNSNFTQFTAESTFSSNAFRWWYDIS